MHILFAANTPTKPPTPAYFLAIGAGGGGRVAVVPQGAGASPLPGEGGRSPGPEYASPLNIYIHTTNICVLLVTLF